MVSSTTFCYRGNELLVPYITRIQQNLQKPECLPLYQKDYVSSVNDHLTCIVIQLSVYNSISNITDSNKLEMKLY